MWERAIEVFLGDVPAHDVGFIHRDFHPGNVLWKTGRLTGVVDWQSASIGPRSVDIGHCRANLMFDDPPRADIFTRMWEEISGSTYDPWGDVATVIGMLDGLRDRPPNGAGPGRVRSRAGTCGHRARMTVRRDEFPPHAESLNLGWLPTF